METFKAVLRDRPGGTRVIIHVPSAAGGSALPMELRRGVAYDAELLAEVRRRLGDGLIDLRLASSSRRRQGCRPTPQAPPVTRRICWTDENFSWYSARIERSTSSSMSSSSAIWLIAPVSSAEIVPLAAITA